MYFYILSELPQLRMIWIILYYNVVIAWDYYYFFACWNKCIHYCTEINVLQGSEEQHCKHKHQARFCDSVVLKCFFSPLHSEVLISPFPVNFSALCQNSILMLLSVGSAKNKIVSDLLQEKASWLHSHSLFQEALPVWSRCAILFSVICHPFLPSSQSHKLIIIQAQNVREIIAHQALSLSKKKWRYISAQLLSPLLPTDQRKKTPIFGLLYATHSYFIVKC